MEVVVAMILAVTVTVALYLALDAGLGSSVRTRDTLGQLLSAETIDRNLRSVCSRIRVPFWVTLEPPGDGSRIEIPYLDGEKDFSVTLEWTPDELTIRTGGSTTRHPADIVRMEPLFARDAWAGVLVVLDGRSGPVEIAALFSSWGIR